MILARTCRPLDNAERISCYGDRLKSEPGFHHLAHAGRVARGVQRQAEIHRLPIPRHRALVVVGKVKRHKARKVKP